MRVDETSSDRRGADPVCETCYGFGEVGGWSGGVASIDGGGGYETVPCPDCTPRGDGAAPAMPNGNEVG